MPLIFHGAGCTGSARREISGQLAKTVRLSSAKTLSTYAFLTYAFLAKTVNSEIEVDYSYTEIVYDSEKWDDIREFVEKIY